MKLIIPLIWFMMWITSSNSIEQDMNKYSEIYETAMNIHYILDSSLDEWQTSIEFNTSCDVILLALAYYPYTNELDISGYPDVCNVTILNY